MMSLETAIAIIEMDHEPDPIGIAAHVILEAYRALLKTQTGGESNDNHH